MIYSTKSIYKPLNIKSSLFLPIPLDDIVVHIKYFSVTKFKFQNNNLKIHVDMRLTNIVLRLLIIILNMIQLKFCLYISRTMSKTIQNASS